jgi:hypothetical protein
MRLSHVVSAAATIALLASAAAPLRAQEFISRKSYIAIVERHKDALLRFVDAAPDSMLGYRPVPGVRTYAEQIEHAAFADALVAHMVITGSAKGMPEFGDTAVYLHNKAALKTMAAAAMDHTIKMLRTTSDAAMHGKIEQFGKQIARGKALMALLDHFPWTLGQVVPYLRVNGVTPPEY